MELHKDVEPVYKKVDFAMPLFKRFKAYCENMGTTHVRFLPVLIVQWQASGMIDLTQRYRRVKSADKPGQVRVLKELVDTLDDFAHVREVSRRALVEAIIQDTIK